MRNILIAAATTAALMAGSAYADEVGTPVFYGAGENCYKVIMAETGNHYAVVYGQLSDPAAVAMVQELNRGAKRSIASSGGPFPSAQAQGGCGDGTWKLIYSVDAP